MNNKGQALVEFVLILPLFLMILFVIIDFGMIFNAKSSLENDSSDIIGLVKSGEQIDKIETLYPELKINLSHDDKYNKIIIETEVDLITPGLNRIMDDPYPIKVERIVPYG